MTYTDLLAVVIFVIHCSKNLKRVRSMNMLFRLFVSDITFKMDDPV